MKAFVGLLVVGGLGLFASVADAATPSKRVSRRELATMGLPSMREISRAEGNQVRAPTATTWVAAEDLDSPGWYFNAFLSRRATTAFLAPYR